MNFASFRVRMAIIVFVVLIMFALHNSFWLWQWDARLPIFLGFMPFAYWYYVLYTLLAVAAMGLVIFLVWPDPPEELPGRKGDA